MSASDLYMRIQARLADLKISPRAASLAAGKGPDVIRNLQRAVSEGKEYDFRVGTLESLASVLQTTPEWLMGGKGSEISPSSQFQSKFDRGDMPIYATVSLDDDRFEISEYVVARIRRTHILEHVPEAYGLIVETSSMTPAYEPGDAILLHPRLGGRANRDMLIRTTSHETGQNIGCIRHLTGRSGHPIQVTRLNPPEIEGISPAAWMTVIIGRLIRFM